MGYGDQIMAAGMAEELYAQDPSRGPVLIVDGQLSPRWQPIWHGNPAIVQPYDRTPHDRYLVTGKGHLPYIYSPYSVATGWKFTDWQARDHRGHIYLDRLEHARAQAMTAGYGDFILLEPTAQRKHVNRRPPATFWHELVERLRTTIDLPILQLDHPEAVPLGYISGYIPHADFREACAILHRAKLLITTEGGLVHAAQALGTRAVVLWGGNISCRALGYPEHRNLVDDAPLTPCGALHACEHCAQAWAKLDVATVIDAVLQELAADGLPRPGHDPHR